MFRTVSKPVSSANAAGSGIGSGNAFSGNQPLHELIAGLSEEFLSELRRIGGNAGGADENIKSGLRAYIDRLEDVYRRL